MLKKNFYDYVIAGAGITGLAVARELKQRNAKSSILVLEKEEGTGFHSSGRNSGVLHSGIYYPVESLKARFCSEGSRMMKEYCLKNELPLDQMGKVIVPTRVEDDFQVDTLAERAVKNGAKVDVIDNQRLKEIEPFVKSASNRALYSPDTSVVAPKSILEYLRNELERDGVSFSFAIKEMFIEPENKRISWKGGNCNYEWFFNCTGQNSDHIARAFGLAENLIILPFKGIYYKLKSSSKIKFNGLVYPVPDLNVPFLGVHSVKSVNGDVYFGPTAVPALGRENYQGLSGISLSDSGTIISELMKQYWFNNQGFRNYAHAEAGRFFKSRFVAAARALVPSLEKSELVSCDKVGIRTQLLDRKKHELVMDFMVENAEASTHVLNVVSPGFTSAFSFAKFIVDKSQGNE